VIVVAGTVGMREDQVEVRADSVASLDAAEQEPEPERASELPEPIPFRKRATADADASSIARPSSRIVIDFLRTGDKVNDLDRIEAIYECILRHPGKDRIVVMVQHRGTPRRLSLPIDNADGPAVRSDLEQIIPGLRVRVEQMGA
jgi:hypothetical protein